MSERVKLNGGHVPSRIDQLVLPLAADHDTGWKPYYQYEGPIKNANFLSCHVSILIGGQSPHPPHSHPEEEILLMLSGEADVILPQWRSEDGRHELRLRAGQFVYYPAQFLHTLRAVGPGPATYVMFKWRARAQPGDAHLPFGHFDASRESFQDRPSVEFDYRLLFEGPTAHLEKLHAHVSKLAPGAGHAPHAHAYEAAMVVLEGELETLGGRVTENGLVYYSGGETHSIRNPGGDAARYVVFEFHGRTPLWRKAMDPHAWARKLRAGLSRG
jgi:quercetin dioxygenase-like cupin family protein